MSTKVNWKKIKKAFYIYFAIAPMLCFVLDLYLSTIQPDPQYGDRTINFDYSIINQVIYFSLWTTIATSIFGILNWMHTDWKNMSFWVNGKNNANLITTCNIVSSLVYIFTLLSTKLFGAGTIVGFNTWYKIIKSILEHMITPALIITFFFLFERKEIKTIKYIKKYSWWSWSIGTPYLLFIFSRAAMLENYYPKNQYEMIIDENGNPFYNKVEPFSPYPYDQLNPHIIGWPGTIALIVFAFAVFWGIGILINYLANLGCKKNISMIFQIEPKKMNFKEN